MESSVEKWHESQNNSKLRRRFFSFKMHAKKYLQHVRLKIDQFVLLIIYSKANHLEKVKEKTIYI